MVGSNAWIFEPTLRSLAAQTFRDFDLVVVDALHERRGEDYGGGAKSTWRPEMAAFGGGYPIRWLPFPDSSRWLDAGYYAISAPKNEAIAHADGELVVQLDDCCSFDAGYLDRCWRAHRRGVCLASLVEHRRGKTTTATDPRLATMIGRRQPVDVSYGYLAFPREAALRVNGFDEGFDGAKTLEDADFTRRLRLAGYRIEIDKRHTVIEHEHGDVSPDAFGGPGNVAKGDRSIKCNAVHQWIVSSREGEDRIAANRHRYTDAEWAFYQGGCPLYLGAGRCAASPHPCNWLRDQGNPDAGSWWGADPNWAHIRDWMSVFSLEDRWRERREREGK